MIDYHIHTRLCNHAGGTMEEYIQRAVDMGFKEICFLDHLTVQETENNLSMSFHQIPFYFQAVQRLKYKYHGMIRVKTGLEIDFNPEYTEVFEEISEIYDFDVIATALHFPEGINIVSRKSDWKKGKHDTDAIHEMYYDQLKKMLNYDYFDIVCHFDLVKKFGMKPSISFENKIDEILAEIKRKDLTVEINTSGYDHPVGEAYPSFDIIKKCHRLGIGITMGSDSHDPEDMGRYYDKVIPMLFSAGYRKVDSFQSRKRRPVAIKNTAA